MILDICKIRKSFNPNKLGCKNIKVHFAFFTLVCFLLVGEESLSQSKRKIIKEYKLTKENVLNMPRFSMENRLDLYKSMDFLPRIVWGKVDPQLISKKECTIDTTSFSLSFYNYDNGQEAEMFNLRTSDGKDLPQEFGFMYDLNKDGKTDYIVYYGGLTIDKNNEFYLYFYHWIDSDFDGKIDVVANNIFVAPEDTRPDMNIILWIIDTDKNGKPDLIDFINVRNLNVDSIKKAEGIWNLKTLFGLKKIDSNDNSYFKFYSEFLKAINE